jgi:hypothetical protein
MKRLFIILTAVTMTGLALLMPGCKYDHPVPEPLPENVSFSEDVVPYFNKSCNYAGCHNTGGVAPDLTPEFAYDDLFAKNQINLDNPEESILYVKIAPGGSMEPYSKPAETAMVLAWIKDGAPNN